jgi:hypothetical protein
MTSNTSNDDAEAESYLDALRPIMNEWDCPEDQEAYRDL